MKTAEAIEALKAAPAGSAVIQHTEFLGETTLLVQKDGVKNVLAYLKSLGFAMFTDMTGIDYLIPEKQTEVIYWLQEPAHYERVRIAVIVKRGEYLPSVCDLWEGANWYERELYDLFGVNFTGHPDLKRILMPDEWQGHPLRRDYALTEEVVEFKHGVKPKVPSEIIPYVKSNPKS